MDPDTAKPFILLVIGGTTKNNWYSVFKDSKVLDRPVQVEMARWEDLEVQNFTSGAVVHLRAARDAIPGTSNGSSRSVVPDLILIRSAPFGAYGQDWTNQLLGLIDVPSINSMDSFYLCLHKPMIYSKLLAVQKRVGAQAFPLIPQTYYSSFKAWAFHDDFPLVVKIGTLHAGLGKARIENQDQWDDLKSIVATQGRYATAEPCITWDYDFRVQKIGNHYRAFRRFSSNWKGQSLDNKDEDIEVTEQLRSWVDLAAEALGMEICALDGVHDLKADRFWIIELNDSACGFVERHYEEDLKFARELVLAKAKKVLLQKMQALPIPAPH